VSGINKQRLARLQAIADFMRTQQRTTFEDIWHFAKTKGKDIKERMLRDDIKLLRNGVLNGVPLNIVIENKEYKIKAAGAKWGYVDLTEAERATLPLVFSVLEPYKEMPAVKMVLNDLVSSHKLAHRDVKFNSAVVTAKSAYDSAAFVSMIAQVMQCISQQKACEFNYFKVSQASSSSQMPGLQEVYPLQIRVYDHRYYLVAVKVTKEWTPEALQLFSLDRVFQYKVDVSKNQDSGKNIKFDWKKLAKAVDLEHYFDHCIGVYRDYTVNKTPSRIYRWFRGWAASHVEAVPLHKSQQIVQRNGVEIRVLLEVYDTNELQAVFRKYGEDCWE
jgi:predicted DNA-binding transcriptional regulator YafY